MRSGKLEAAGGYQFLRKVTMSFLNVMLLCCSSHLSTEQFSSMFPNVSTCVSLLFNFPGDSQQQLCSLSLPCICQPKSQWNEMKCIVLTSYCSSSGREEQIVFEALEDLTILCRGHWNWKASGLSGKDWLNSCVNEDHGIMILCPVCPVDFTDWKYFSGTLCMKT